MSKQSTFALLVVTALAGSALLVNCGPANTDPSIAAKPGAPPPDPKPIEPKPLPPRPGPTDTGDPAPVAPPAAH